MPVNIRNLDLDRSIAAGDPLDYEVIEQARDLARHLQNLFVSEYEPQVTEEITAAAASRAVAVETAYASMEYSPQNMLQAFGLINHRLQVIEEQGKIGLAQTFNSRIITGNKNLRGALMLEPLQKVIPGYGRNTALPFIQALGQAGQLAFHQEFPVQPIGDVPAIGSTPPDFDAHVVSYGHIDVIRMMVFYNQTFNILPQEGLGDRVEKFLRFLTEY